MTSWLMQSPRLAVQMANARAAAASPHRPQILLDGRPQWPHHTAGGDYGRSMCQSFLARQPEVDKLDPQTPDGLYYYSEEERRAAAEWLHAYQVKKVRDTLDEELP